MESNLYTFLHFVRGVYDAMPSGLQACVLYSISAVLIVSLIILIARWN